MHSSDQAWKIFYEKLEKNISTLRAKISKPLTFTEKLLFIHAIKQEENSFYCLPNHIALNDGAAQLTLLQFANSGKKYSHMTTSLHCDHLIWAEKGAKEDLEKAYEEHQEIYDFLESAAVKFNLDFWKPGSGYMHHQLLENYLFPGALVFGSDPQISFVGGLASLGLEKGSFELLDAMLGVPTGILRPKIIGVYLTGKLQGWGSAKDVILHLLPHLLELEIKGAILEFFGPGAETLSCTSKATICSMASEMEALSCLFHCDESLLDFLAATQREAIVGLVKSASCHLKADLEILEHPETYFDNFLTIDLTDLQPSINGPFASHHSVPLPLLAQTARQQNFPELSAALIGSCTNASYEDLRKAAQIARQALKHGLKIKVPLYISPGSETIKKALMQEGSWKVFQDIGAIILASGCGPCTGQWKRHDIPFGERNSLICTHSCTATGHQDANPNTHAFIASPEMVMAFAFSGTLLFNPSEENLINAQGLPVKLMVNSNDQLSSYTLMKSEQGCLLPKEGGALLPLIIHPNSERLQLLEPLASPLERDFGDLRLLVKMVGKCTTDHIAPAGKWAKCRGHLDNISHHLFSLAPNRFKEEVGKGKNLLTGNVEPFSKIARDYKKEDIGWIAVASEISSEGKSYEYAAMGIRHLGGKAFIANNFTPDFEKALKKMGVLALTFEWPLDGDKIKEDDLIDLLGVGNLAVGSSLELLLKHADGTTDRLSVRHDYNEHEIAWFKSGGFLNALAL